MALIAEGVTALAMLATYKLASVNWGESGFSEYSVIRRLLSFTLPVAILGLDIGLTRAAAQIHSRSNEDLSDILHSAVQLVMLGTAIVLGFLNVDRQATAGLLLGDTKYAFLISSLSLLITGYAIQVCCYSYLRGSTRFVEAIALHLTTHAIIPLTIFGLFASTLDRSLAQIGWTTILISVVWLIIHGLHPFKLFRNPPPIIRGLFTYSIGRVPSAVAMLGISSIPTIVIANELGLSDAGAFAFAAMATGFISTLIAPVSFIILPTITRLFATHDLAGAIQAIQRSTLIVIAIAAVGTLGIYIKADVISVIFAGPDQSVAPILRASIIGAFPLAYFSCMRNVIDARYKSAINSRHTVIAFAFLCLGCWLMTISVPSQYLVKAITFMYVASLVVLAFLTWRTVMGIVNAPTKTDSPL